MSGAGLGRRWATTADVVNVTVSYTGNVPAILL